MANSVIYYEVFFDNCCNVAHQDYYSPNKILK